MENLGIYHRDIKPHNFLVSPQFDIKIIDFSISEIKQNVDTTSVTGQNIIQGTKGYMAPEVQDAFDKGLKAIKYNVGKADVFSLGLCILQLMIMEDLSVMNKIENNNQLKAKIEAVKVAWVKQLLYKMLDANYNNRLSFRRLISYLPGVDTYNQNVASVSA